MFRFQVFLFSFPNQIYFRMNVYAEFRTNRSPHRIRKRNYITTFRSTAIHQHQGLLIVYSRRT